MYKIFINNEQIDLMDNRSVVINKELFDIAEPDVKTLSITNRFVLLKTHNNLRIFNLLSEQRFNVEYNAKVYLYSDFIFEGKAIITDVQEDNFTIQIIDSIREFWESTKKNEMWKLDLSDSDFVFNRTNFELLKIPSNTSVWQWSAIDQRNVTAGTTDNYFDSIDETNLAINRPHYKTKELLKEIINQNGYTEDLTEVESVLDELILLGNGENFFLTDCEYEFISESVTADVLLDFDNAVENFTPINFYEKVYTSIIAMIYNGLKNYFVNTQYTLRGTISDTSLTIMTIEYRKPYYSGSVLTSNEYRIRDGIIDVILDVQEKDTIMSIKFNKDVTVNLLVSGLISEIDYYLCKENVSREISSVVSGTGYIELEIENLQNNNTTLFRVSDNITIYGGLYDGQDGVVSLSSTDVIRVTGITYSGDDDQGRVYLNFPNADKRVYKWYRQEGVSTFTPLLEDYLIKASYNLPSAWNQFDFLQELSKLFYLDFNIVDNAIRVTFKKDIALYNALELNKLVKNSRKYSGKTDLYDELIFKFNNDLKQGVFSKIYNNPNFKDESNEIIKLLSDSTGERIVEYSSGVTELFKVGYANIYTSTKEYNENEDDRAVINPIFFFVTDRDLVASALISEINAVGYFQNSSKTDVPNDNTLIMSELYDTYYSFLFDKLGETYLIDYQCILSYIDFLKVMEEKTVYDSKLNKYFLVLSISKFNPSSISELKCIGL